MGVLCCHFRPKMFSPSDHVRYHSCTLGAHVLATIVGPSPNGPQFCHIRYIRPGGVTPVDHESAGAKAAAKPAPRAIASSSSASATHPVPVMQTEHVQQFKVCYSRTQKFFTVPLDPQ